MCPTEEASSRSSESLNLPSVTLKRRWVSSKKMVNELGTFKTLLNYYVIFNQKKEQICAFVMRAPSNSLCLHVNKGKKEFLLSFLFFAIRLGYSKPSHS